VEILVVFAQSRRDPGIGNSTIPNPGIENSSPGLQSLASASQSTNYYSTFPDNDVRGPLHCTTGCDRRWSSQRAVVEIEHLVSAHCRCLLTSSHSSSDEHSDALNASRFSFFHGWSCLITREAANGVDTNRETTSPWSDMIYGVFI